MSTGPGAGGGVGTGSGTGIGSGRGPGLGAGSGGGTGGGIYRPGGAVSAPRLIKEVKPKYTPEALRDRIQGTVVLEAVVSGDGCATRIQVVRSLDVGGLDEEAVAAVAQWRFEPGRLAGAPVDVLVVIMLDFSLRYRCGTTSLVFPSIFSMSVCVPCGRGAFRCLRRSGMSGLT
jgi:periplasmic protein TonB